MSSPKEKPELLAGHPPAVVAGGMRIVQHKKEGSEKSEMTAEDVKEFGPAKAPQADMHRQQALVSGVVTQGDRDFQANAIKQHHDKPLPQHDKNEKQHGQTTRMQINQPRK